MGVTFVVPFLDPEFIPAATQLANVVEFSFGPPSAQHIATAHTNHSIVGWQVGTAPLFAGTSVEHTRLRQPAAEIVRELMATG